MHSPKRWFAIVNMTSYCDVTSGIYPITMTTIRHCTILEFGRGEYNQASRPGHHQTSACHCWPYWHAIFPVFLFVIFGFCLLFVRLNVVSCRATFSLCKYFLWGRLHCSVYIINSLLAANSMCSWVPYSFDCKPRLTKFFHHFMRLTIKGGLLFYFFTLSKGTDDAQSFLGYVLSTNLFFRILFS